MSDFCSGLVALLNFDNLVKFIQILADVSIVIISLLSLYLTTLSRRIVVIGTKCTTHSFFGRQVIVKLHNKSLHVIPVQCVFFMKEIDGIIYRFKVFESDDAVTVDGFKIGVIESDVYTCIFSDDKDELFEFELTHDAVVGVVSGGRISFSRLGKKASIHRMRQAIKKRKYVEVKQITFRFDGTVLSRNVDFAVYLKNIDSNNDVIWKPVFGISNANDGKSIILSDYINGHNGINGEFQTKKDVKKAIKRLGIKKNDFQVVMFRDRTINSDHADTDIEPLVEECSNND